MLKSECDKKTAVYAFEHSRMASNISAIEHAPLIRNTLFDRFLRENCVFCELQIHNLCKAGLLAEQKRNKQTNKRRTESGGGRQRYIGDENESGLRKSEANVEKKKKKRKMVQNTFARVYQLNVTLVSPVFNKA